MTTTALVPYNPTRAPEPDAGRGLRFSKGWLVSTPSARHVRWLAPWIQALIADAVNLPMLAVRTLIRDEWLRHRAAFGVAAVITVWAFSVDPILGLVVGLVCWLLPAWRLTVELTTVREVTG